VSKADPSVPCSVASPPPSADHGNGTHVSVRITDPAVLAGLDWQPLRPGVEVHYLHQDAQAGAALLIRYLPGGAVPRHRHEGFEHIYVLSGSQEDELGLYEAGALVIHPPGSEHSVSSREGCVVLVIRDRPISFFEP
jgi:anti-sigma factor ChrR (cupin superfamily)